MAFGDETFAGNPRDMHSRRTARYIIPLLFVITVLLAYLVVPDPLDVGLVYIATGILLMAGAFLTYPKGPYRYLWIGLTGGIIILGVLFALGRI